MINMTIELNAMVLTEVIRIRTVRLSIEKAAAKLHQYKTYLGIKM